MRGLAGLCSVKNFSQVLETERFTSWSKLYIGNGFDNIALILEK